MGSSDAVGCCLGLVCVHTEWLATYESIGSDIAGFNAPDWAGNPRSLGRVGGSSNTARLHMQQVP